MFCAFVRLAGTDDDGLTVELIHKAAVVTDKDYNCCSVLGRLEPSMLGGRGGWWVRLK